MKLFFFLNVLVLIFQSCQSTDQKFSKTAESNMTLKISRDQYLDQLEGFWLGECIANWTGLITEMDKIGNMGAIKTGPFYTSENWGGPDQPNIWSGDTISDISPLIDFVLVKEGQPWGADDDTDIEYMYQELMYNSDQLLLTGEQIRDGWLKHIKAEEENYLWVSNQKAFDLMREGIIPPSTGDPELNEHTEMIDAQLTTEIFGLYAPGHPEIAFSLAELPIKTTASGNAEDIAQFYVVMYSLASKDYGPITMSERIIKMANEASTYLPEDGYPKAMYDFVKGMYQKGFQWEATRDSLYQRYQVEEADGYKISSKELYCNGCFAAGINFGASLISLFYGEGNIKETIKIGALTGWDADNPTATWGGMLGFILGNEKLRDIFGNDLSDQFNIHRTRQNFPNNGIDSFSSMAQKGMIITERVVEELLAGKVVLEE